MVAVLAPSRVTPSPVTPGRPAGDRVGLRAVGPDAELRPRNRRHSARVYRRRRLVALGVLVSLLVGGAVLLTAWVSGPAGGPSRPRLSVLSAR